jgi:hypothetical protein
MPQDNTKTQGLFMTQYNTNNSTLNTNIKEISFKFKIKDLRFVKKVRGLSNFNINKKAEEKVPSALIFNLAPHRPKWNEKG